MKYELALQNYNKSLELNPQDPLCYNHKAITQSRLKLYAEAIESYKSAVAFGPEYGYLKYEILHIKMLICDWSGLAEHIADLANEIQIELETASPFGILSVIDSISLQQRSAQTHVQINHPVNPVLGAITPTTASGKIRLGYFSANFHNHPVAYLTAGLFESHDKNKFELIAFSFGPDTNSTEDAMRPRLQAAFDQFLDVRSMTDIEVAQLARTMGIDIAVDLMGFTEDARPGIFAARAALVQVNYLGYPGTMGAEYIDYIIADPTLIPVQSQFAYTEKIAYLPHCYQVNDRKRQISDRVFDREELDLPTNGFVFCSFNNSYKITPSTFDGWMRILKQVPGSVLWLSESNAIAAANLKKEAEKRGVSSSRLVFAKRLPLLSDHLARYRQADLFLDTLPYNAHTTASDALWSGLPVLTNVGESYASRAAASIMHAIGLDELITGTQDGYETLAIELAKDTARLNEVRVKLQRNRLSTPLFDTQLFASNIEAAFCEMHKRSQEGQLPQHLEIKLTK